MAPRSRRDRSQAPQASYATGGIWGVDGCRGGWCAALLACDDVPQLAVFERLEDLLALEPASVALDMPIGLPSGSRVTARACDREARALLGRRASSVFPAPTRGMLRARSFDSLRGSGLTLQAFHLFPKLREVDRCLRSDTRARRIVRECHPELAFRDLAGAPLEANKRSAAGLAERRILLARAFAVTVRRIEAHVRAFCADHPRARLAPDDAHDALVLALAARDLAAGTARCTPERPERDRHGLDQAIWRLAARTERPARRPRRREARSDDRRERILSVVDDIPRGRVASYGQVARAAGLPGRARLVGRILSQLDADSELPWWRVLTAAGRPSGDGELARRQGARLVAEGVLRDARDRVDWSRSGWRDDE